MKKQSKLLFVVVLLCLSFGASGQDTLRFTHQEFLAVVRNYHPLAFRYRLQNKIAAAEVRKARGNFDPVLGAKNGAKTIDGVDYYRETDVALDIPTWYGVTLNGGYSDIEGQRLDNSTTKGGLYQFGVTVPLAKNLVYDKRRAVLDQARYAREMTEAEQHVLTNQLLLDADNTYWEWVRCYELYLLQSRNVAINRERMDLLRKSFSYGERAAIDTTEALSQLQSFELQAQDAYLKFVKATQELSLYLWQDNQKPYEVSATLIPSDRLHHSSAYDDYPSLLTQIGQQPVEGHAALQYYTQKQHILESERRLKAQSFLPKLDFTYNFFNKENYRSDYFPLFQNNYQYGLKLEIPLFLRQARADYRIAQSKLQQNSLDRDYKKQELHAKITVYRNEVLTYSNQIAIAQQNIRNYQRLLAAEEARFGNGESSLFLINSRENKLLDAEQKLLDIRMKFLNGYNQLKWLHENLRFASR